MNSQELVKWKYQAENLSASADRRIPSHAVPLTPVQRTAAWLLRRYSWTILGCITASVVACLIYWAQQPRTYRATANLAIYRDSDAGVSLGKNLGIGSGDLDDYSVSLDTQLHILQSRTLALAVVRKLGVDRDAVFMREAKPELVNRPRDRSNVSNLTPLEDAAIDVLLAGLSVNPLKQTRIVEVSFTGPNPEPDAKIVNAMVDGFIDDSIRSRYEASTLSAALLSGQLSDRRTKVEDSQQNQIAYERDHNILWLLSGTRQGILSREDIGILESARGLSYAVTACSDSRGLFLFSWCDVAINAFRFLVCITRDTTEREDD
ncbi:MAG TPA: hypothetical protein VM912_17785 [Terriglobales bacterium]|nr:hypothetical protein [Terriglobales bacterium]